MLKDLKEQVYEANINLQTYKLVISTWGNVSGINREKGLIAIKPSGVSYDKLTVHDIVLIDLDGKVVDSKLKPSSDTATHIELYKAFSEVMGIAHTHSTYATAWAQAGVPIPIIGTTHADYFSNDIPCTEDMTAEEIRNNYEKETGTCIIRTFKDINPMHIPGVLVKNHGPFTWGKDALDAFHNTLVLEQVAKMAYISYNINPKLTMNNELVTKHYERKHGANSYYGQ